MARKCAPMTHPYWFYTNMCIKRQIANDGIEMQELMDFWSSFLTTMLACYISYIIQKYPLNVLKVKMGGRYF